MISIAVSGGVACGKTSFCRRFMDWIPQGGAEFFSCDAEVRAITECPEISHELYKMASDYGGTIRNGEELDRKAFRDLVFENQELRAKVESLLHPLVRERLEEHLSGLSDSARIFLVEVPLLYEVDFPISRDIDVVVGSSPKSQERRLILFRGLQPELARKVLNTQISIYEKLNRADIVVWNDGDLESFQSQADHLALRCKSLFDHD